MLIGKEYFLWISTFGCPDVVAAADEVVAVVFVVDPAVAAL